MNPTDIESGKVYSARRDLAMMLENLAEYCSGLGLTYPSDGRFSKEDSAAQKEAARVRGFSLLVEFALADEPNPDVAASGLMRMSCWLERLRVRHVAGAAKRGKQSALTRVFNQGLADAYALYGADNPQGPEPQTFELWDLIPEPKPKQANGQDYASGTITNKVSAWLKKRSR